MGEHGEWTNVERPMPVFMADGVEPRQPWNVVRGAVASGVAGGWRKTMGKPWENHGKMVGKW